MRALAAVGVGLLLALGPVACKGSTVAEKECADAPAPSPGSVGKLPPGFPLPGGVVLTSAQLDGPSVVARGYADASLQSVYDSYRNDLAKAPFTVTRNEKTANEAEVGFTGPATSGQIRLGVACKGRTSVEITVRPG